MNPCNPSPTQSCQPTCSKSIPLIKKKRTTHSISFKIDVCTYFQRIPNPTTAGCARHYKITEKQVRYFRKRESLYRSIKTCRMRRNAFRPELLRTRAKYAHQEHQVYTWFLESRAQGKKLY